MKQKLIKKRPGFITMIIFPFAVLLFNGSCRKDTRREDADKPPPENPKIVFTDVEPDSILLKLQTDTFRLDLNNDGITDFEFERSYIVLASDNFLGTWCYAINLILKPAGINNAIMTGGSGHALALDSSKAITPDSLWATTSQVLLYGGISATGHCITSLPAIIGNWLNVSDRYLGLKFIKGNNTYYGWVRLSCSYSRTPYPGPRLIIGGRQLILKDYAYNSIPNQAILAGQTK